MRRSSLGSLLPWVLVAACASRSTGNTTGADDDGDARDYVGKDAKVEASTLVFTDPAERERFERARACLARRAEGWEHYPLRKIGNFIEEDWCRGPGAERGCEGGGFRETAGVDWAGVGTLHYPQDWPQGDGPKVFGVQVQAGHRPADGGWGAWVWVSTNGKSIVGDGGSVGFERAGDEDGAFYVGTGYSWEIAETQLLEEVEGDGWQLLDRVRSSPQALRDEALGHWTALEAKVLGALERGEVLECVYGEYEGNGIPPECLRKVPLSAEAAGREAERIRAKVQGIRAAFDADGDRLHARLLEVAPVGCF